MNGIVHLVDDDEAIRDALTWLLRSRGLPLQTWASAEAFLSDYSNVMSGCLILDIRMCGMSGVELFDELHRRGCMMPVIFLTGHGDVPLAVNLLKRGAYDFLEKPFDDNALIERVQEALRVDAERRQQDHERARIQARLALLTERERQVMEAILAGKLNKVIADDLGIAMRTVEVHRARVFDKMGVRSAVELAQILARYFPSLGSKNNTP
ncbi:MAG: response regulator [Rhodocyclaceae bacterium]|nr:response regulator [Rhodocyclaceae bacterium]